MSDTGLPPPIAHPPPLPPGGSSSQTTPVPSTRTIVANTSVWASISFLKIDKSRDGNWFAWKTRIALVLELIEAYEIATGAVPQPHDPVAAADWKEKDLIAQELITTAIKDEQAVHILGCNTSAEMWEALHTVHEPRRLRSIFSAKRALYRAQAEEGADIAAHLNDMKVLRQRLALLGHRVDDAEFNAILVASLPRSWESFTSYLGF